MFANIMFLYLQHDLTENNIDINEDIDISNSTEDINNDNNDLNVSQIKDFSTQDKPHKETYELDNLWKAIEKSDVSYTKYKLINELKLKKDIDFIADKKRINIYKENTASIKGYITLEKEIKKHNNGIIYKGFLYNNYKRKSEETKILIGYKKGGDLVIYVDILDIDLMKEQL